MLPHVKQFALFDGGEMVDGNVNLADFYVANDLEKAPRWREFPTTAASGPTTERRSNHEREK